MHLSILLLLLPLAHARLGVRVAVPKGGDIDVQLVGEDDHIIDDEETKSFRLSDEPLKEACRLFSGARPTDAFLHSPTPWGDLYQRYGWPQVHRVLKPVKVTLLGIKSQPEIIATHRFTNNGTHTAQYKGELSQSVTNTITNSWSTGNTINVGQEINYEFVIPVGKVGGKTTFSYARQWGNSGSESKAVTLKATAGVTVPVAPGASVITSLTASRGEMELEVKYEASLYGLVAANYEYTYKGHHFRGYEVNAVMQAGGLPRTVSRTEIIKVGFYTDVEIWLNEKSGLRKMVAQYATVN